MSRPTLSRLENLADWRALARIGLGGIDLYCRSFKTPPQHIVLDIDDTDDPVHGQQELALFNAHYDCTCFQLIHIFDGLSGKPVLSLLRPGKRPSGDEVAKVLRHVIRRICKHWPKVQILLRGDSHYCSEPALALLEALIASVASPPGAPLGWHPIAGQGGVSLCLIFWRNHRNCGVYFRGDLAIRPQMCSSVSRPEAARALPKALCISPNASVRVTRSLLASSSSIFARSRACSVFRSASSLGDRTALGPRYATS